MKPRIAQPIKPRIARPIKPRILRPTKPRIVSIRVHRGGRGIPPELNLFDPLSSGEAAKFLNFSGVLPPKIGGFRLVFAKMGSLFRQYGAFPHQNAECTAIWRVFFLYYFCTHTPPPATWTVHMYDREAKAKDCEARTKGLWGPSLGLWCLSHGSWGPSQRLWGPSQGAVRPKPKVYHGGTKLRIVRPESRGCEAQSSITSPCFFMIIEKSRFNCWL